MLSVYLWHFVSKWGLSYEIPLLNELYLCHCTHELVSHRGGTTCVPQSGKLEIVMTQVRGTGGTSAIRVSHAPHCALYMRDCNLLQVVTERYTHVALPLLYPCVHPSLHRVYTYEISELYITITAILKLQVFTSNKSA